MDTETAQTSTAAPSHEAALTKYFAIFAESLAAMAARRPFDETIDSLGHRIRKAQNELDEQQKTKARSSPEFHADFDSRIAKIERRLAGFLIANDAMRAEQAAQFERAEDLGHTANVMKEHLEDLGILERGAF